MPGFDDAWRAVAKQYSSEQVSGDLKPLLRSVYSVYQEVISAPVNLIHLKKSLEVLFDYLAHSGRTNANCWATDMFFCLSEGWERDWTETALPDDFHDVLAIAGQALHDTVNSPEIASNFDCLPEQILERVKALKI